MLKKYKYTHLYLEIIRAEKPETLYTSGAWNCFNHLYFSQESLDLAQTAQNRSIWRLAFPWLLPCAIYCYSTFLHVAFLTVVTGYIQIIKTEWKTRVKIRLQNISTPLVVRKGLQMPERSGCFLLAEQSPFILVCCCSHLYLCVYCVPCKFSCKTWAICV